MSEAYLHSLSTASPDAAATPPDEVYALAKSRGVDFVTLTDHDALDGRRPALADWLCERRAEGDAIAQQGLVSGRTPPRDVATHQIPAGHRILAQAGAAPNGYRAGGLAHAIGARRDLATMFRWWTAAGRLPVLSPRGALRVDVRPGDFDRSPHRTRAMERPPRRAVASRRAITFDDLPATDVVEVGGAARTDVAV